MSVQTDLFDSIYNDVVALTNRPDLSAETEIAVRTATLSIHHRASFLRDLVTKPVQLPNSAYNVTLDIQVLLERCRGVSSIIPLGSDFAVVDHKIDLVEIGDIYDPEYGTMKNDIAYMAGTGLNVRCSLPCYGFVVSYYQSPSTIRESYNSWIAQLAPASIIYTAAAIVLTTNGNEEKAKSYREQVQGIHFPELVSNFSTGAQR